MSEKKGVYFLEGVPPYNPGERAAFPLEEADHYIDQEWAVPVDKDGEPILPEEDAAEVDDDEGGKGDEGDEDEDPGVTLPENFPGRKALIDSGIKTMDMVRAVQDFEGVKGVGRATEIQIREYLQKLES